MAFLTLDGLTIEVRDGTFRQTTDDLRDEGRAEDGSWVESETATKREWMFQTTPMTPSNAVAHRGWLNGWGHRFPFDSTKYSSKVLGPNAGGTHSISAVQSKFGGSSLLVGSGSTIVYAFGSAYSSAWSISAWKYTSGAAWAHYGLTSGSTQYKAGAAHTPTGSDSVALWAAMSSGSLTLDGQDEGGVNTASAYYDHLVVRPYVMTAAMFAAEAAATSAHPGLPKLAAVIGETSGTTISTNVYSRVVEETHIQVRIGSTFYPDARILTVRLKEA